MTQERILDHDPKELVVSVVFALQMIRRFLSIEDRKKIYGYFTVLDIENPNRIWSQPIGEIPPEKRHKNFRLSREKAERLFRKFLGCRHTSSWESRNKDEEKFAGAILVSGRYIVSFSGLPDELADEAVCLYGMTTLFQHSFQEQAYHIAQKSNNQYYLEMIQGRIF